MRYPLSHADLLSILALRYQIWGWVRSEESPSSGILSDTVSIQFQGLHLSCSVDIFMHIVFLLLYLSSLEHVTERDSTYFAKE